MLAGAVIALLCFMLTHRRLTPYLHLQLDELPPLHDGMQALAGLTGGAVYEGNRCSVLQNGALFPGDASRTSKRRIAPSTWKPSCGPRAKSSVSSSKLLCSKARQGVKVRVLIDALGGSGADAARVCSSYAMPASSSHEYCRPQVVESAALQSPHASQAADRRRRDRLHVRPRHRRSVARRRGRRRSLARHGRAPGRSGGRRAAVGVHGELDGRDALRARGRRLLSTAGAQGRRRRSRRQQCLRRSRLQRSRCCTPWRSRRHARK